MIATLLCLFMFFSSCLHAAQTSSYAMQPMDIGVKSSSAMRSSLPKELSLHFDKRAQKLEAIMSEARVNLPLVLWKVIEQYRGSFWKFDRYIEINHNDSLFKTIGVLKHVSMFNNRKPIAISGSFHHNNIHLWDLSTGELYATLKAHSGPVYDVAYDVTSQMLISASGDKSVKLWRLNNNSEADLKKVHCFKNIHNHHSIVVKVAISPNGKRFASASLDGTIHTWLLANGKLSHSFRHPHLRYVAWNYDGSLLLSAGVEDVCVWDPITSKLIKQHNYRNQLYGNQRYDFSHLQAFASSPAGNHMALAIRGQSIALHDIITGETMYEMEDSAHEYHREGLGFSPSGIFLAGRMPACSIKIWDAPTGVLLMSGTTDKDTGKWVHFIDDGTLLTQGYGTQYIGDKNGRVNVYTLDD